MEESLSRQLQTKKHILADVCLKYAEAKERIALRIIRNDLTPDDCLKSDLALIGFIDSLRYEMDPELRSCFDRCCLCISADSDHAVFPSESARRRAVLSFCSIMIKELS